MTFPIRKGSKGNEVGIIQNYLNIQLRKLGLNPLAVDKDFGTLTENALHRVSGQTQVSRAFFDTMRRFLADHFNNRKSGSVDLSSMEGGELITWLTQNDMKIQHGLLLLRELDSKLREKGIDTSAYRFQIERLAENHGRRYSKILNDGFVKTNKAVGSAYKWLRDKWNEVIGIPAIPIAAGIIVTGLIVTGTVIVSRYMGDAVDSQEELETKIPALMAAYQKLNEAEYKALIEQIQGYGADKHASGSLGQFGTALKYGAYLVGGVLVVTVIRNVTGK